MPTLPRLIWVLLLLLATSAGGGLCVAQQRNFEGQHAYRPGQPRMPASLERQQQEAERRLQEVQQEHEQEMAEWDQRFRQLDEARQKQEAPAWVPYVMLPAALGLLALVIWHARREQSRQNQSCGEARGALLQQEPMQSVSAPDDPPQSYRRDAWTVAAMIAEDADRERILAKVDELALQPEEVQDFLVVFRMSMLTLPMPWYRPDIPQLVEEVCQRVTGTKE